MSNNERMHDDILDIYKNFKGLDGKPIIEDMEPGVIYGLNNGHKRAVQRIEVERTNLKKRYSISSILNMILLIAIIGISLFACITFRNLNSQYISLSEKYDVILSNYDESKILSNELASKLAYTVQNLNTSIPEEGINIGEEDVKDNNDEVDPVMDKFMELPLDRELIQYIYNKAIEYDIPPEILFSVAWKESTYNPNAKSSTNDHGLFQINECNFKSLANKFGWSLDTFWKNIYDPYVNTDCAVIILKDCRDKYNNDNWHHVLMRYNLGPGKTNEFFADGIYSTKYSRATVKYAADKFGFTDIELG